MAQCLATIHPLRILDGRQTDDNRAKAHRRLQL